MTESVYIFDSYSAKPVYHTYGTITDRDGAQVDVTFCGLVMYDGRVRYSATLRRDHADCFARPCRKCFEAQP